MAQKPQFPSFTAPLVLDKPGVVAMALRAICAQLNDCFTLAQGYLRRTMNADCVEATSPATADEPFRVAHNLGATPRFVSAIMEAAGSVCATPEDKREWSAASVKIRCSVANTTMIVKVEA
jgi:hypothetical protein